MKLVIAATNKVAIPAINALSKNNEITIVTTANRPAGRGKVLTPSEVANEFPNAVKPKDENELSEILKGSDLLITISYGKLLSEETLAIPKFGGINLHFSLLPRWRGAAPVQRAIEAGDTESGVSVFQMDKGMDTGPIWIQKMIPVPENFTSEDLFKELSILGVSALEETLMLIQQGDAKPSAQIGNVSIAKKIEKSECRIKWSEPSISIIRKVRAFSINPGVTTVIRNQSLRIEAIEISDSKLNPGELSSQGEVGTGDGSIKIISLTPAGKRTMLAKEWLNGFKPLPGERFE